MMLFVWLTLDGDTIVGPAYKTPQLAVSAGWPVEQPCYLGCFSRSKLPEGIEVVE